MSADNWAICPKCKANEDDEEEQVKKQYGKVSATEYLALVDKLREPTKQEYNLREDYEIGILPDGEFYVSYSGRCNKCGFSFDYGYKKAVV